MLAGVTTVCFFASYAVALALEVSRLLFRSAVRGVFMLGFAAAGLVAQTAFLYYRAIHAVGAPLSSEKDWYLVATWVLVVIYLYLAILHPKINFGLFLLPLVLALIAAATFLAPDQPLAREPASRIWGAVHGMAIMLASVAVFMGFVAGLMYLGQVRRLKHKRPLAGRVRLPSLEWLQWANGRAIVISVLMLGIGVLAGMILNRIRSQTGGWRLPWNDPVLLSTWLLFFWLLAALILTTVYRPIRAGRKVAYLTLASFVFLAIMLAVGLLMDSRHWGREKKEPSNGAASHNGAPGTDGANLTPPPPGGRPC
jgi:ABC-type transport system involved in cytochrome c biogenesis permease subunit